MSHNACKTSEPREPQEASPIEKTLHVVDLDTATTGISPLWTHRANDPIQVIS